LARAALGLISYLRVLIVTRSVFICLVACWGIGAQTCFGKTNYQDQFMIETFVHRAGKADA